MTYRFIGYAIVSDDGMLADAFGQIPPSLVVPADQDFFMRGLDAAARAELNRFLRTFERRLTSEAGLPGRPWYRHQVDAPGQYTGYGAKTLPAIREAIEQRHWEEANTQIRTTAALLDAARAAIEAMTASLRADAG